MDEPLLMMPGQDLPGYGFNEFDIYGVFTGKFHIEKMMKKRHCFAQLLVCGIYLSEKLPPINQLQ